MDKQRKIDSQIEDNIIGAVCEKIAGDIMNETRNLLSKPIIVTIYEHDLRNEISLFMRNITKRFLFPCISPFLVWSLTLLIQNNFEDFMISADLWKAISIVVLFASSILIIIAIFLFLISLFNANYRDVNDFLKLLYKKYNSNKSE